MPAIAALLLASTAPAAAQEEGSWLCRVHWQEQTYGGDTLATTGVIELNTAAPQEDGGVFYMGQGRADIVFSPGGACTATSGGNATGEFMAIVMSDDAGGVTVDITSTGAGEFPVAVRCMGINNSTMNISVTAPPSVTMRYADGATATYDESNRTTFGGRVGQRGTVRLEFCRPEPS